MKRILIALGLLAVILLSGCIASERTYVTLDDKLMEYKDYSGSTSIKYINYGQYKVIEFRTETTTNTYAYLQLMVHCENGVVCYTTGYDDEGGLSCFRHKDMAERYCEGLGGSYNTTKEALQALATPEEVQNETKILKTIKD